MKLTEKKSKVPASFLTSYISNAWDQVGIIKADIDGIKNEFKVSKEIIESLENLSDAYLILAGRFQNYLDNKGEIEIPEDDEEELKENLNEKLDEAAFGVPRVEEDDIRTQVQVRQSKPADPLDIPMDVMIPTDLEEGDEYSSHTNFDAIWNDDPLPVSSTTQRTNIADPFANAGNRVASSGTPSKEEYDDSGSTLDFGDMPAADSDYDEYQAAMEMLSKCNF